ncbi:MAG: hypothetical protein NTV34_21880, partial [Proteobacteria bacterium]|nr:hypothetical protein [Pseudomonadota bacterium]
MTTEETIPPTSIICATNSSLKTALRDGGKLAGIASSMLLEKTGDVVRELKEHPKSWLLIDYQIPPQD